MPDLTSPAAYQPTPPHPTPPSPTQDRSLPAGFVTSTPSRGQGEQRLSLSLAVRQTFVSRCEVKSGSVMREAGEGVSFKTLKNITRNCDSILISMLDLISISNSSIDRLSDNVSM